MEYYEFIVEQGKAEASIKDITLPDMTKATGVIAAEALNEYFCNLGSNLASEITHTNKKLTIESVKCKFKWEFAISEKEVYEEVLKFSDSQSSDLCHLNSKIAQLVP